MTVHRGRKPSAKPGAKHMAALQAAHGKDHKVAHRAALDYAKELTRHMKTETVEPDDIAPPTKAPPDARAQLAKLLMSRKK